jgi:hypothetical protein
MMWRLAVRLLVAALKPFGAKQCAKPNLLLSTVQLVLDRFDAEKGKQGSLQCKAQLSTVRHR